MSKAALPKSGLHNNSPRISLSRLSRCLKRPVLQDTDNLRRAIPRRNPGHIVPQQLHERHCRVVICVLERHLVRKELVVQAGLCEGLPRRHPPVDDVDDALEGRGDDPAAACGPGNQVHASIWAGDDNRRAGRQRPLPGADVVHRRWFVPKVVGSARD